MDVQEITGPRPGAKNTWMQNEALKRHPSFALDSKGRNVMSDDLCWLVPSFFGVGLEFPRIRGPNEDPQLYGPCYKSRSHNLWKQPG